MDTWDDDFREPTEDERTARRALGVAIALINSSAPLSTTQLRRDFYPDLGDAAFKKAFQRDRTRLALGGVVIQSAGSRGDEQTWLVDEERSFVRDYHLTPEDALTLDCMLLPLAADPSFPFARDLRMALTKIDRSFGNPSVAVLPPSARKRNNNLTRIEDCMIQGHPASILYTRADGSELKRTVSPYGLFVFRDKTYLVAPETDDDGTALGDPHTFLVDRIRSVKPIVRASYQTPLDFDVRDYQLLPFQMGDSIYEATFLVPTNRLQDLRMRLGSQVEWGDVDEGNVLRTTVSHESNAASWAIAEGVRPIAPESLVREWRHILLDACEGDCHEQ